MIVENLKMNKALKEAQIFISYDKHKRPVLYIGNGEESVMLKRFFSQFQYERFMAEAVLCHMYADKKYLNHIKNSYYKIVKYLHEVENEDNI